MEGLQPAPAPAPAPEMRKIDKFDELKEPEDSYNIAYMIHFLLGAGYLVPWNSFITAVDYFEYLYPTKHVSKVFSVGYMVAAAAVLFVLTCWSTSGKTKLPEFRIRMNFGLGLFVAALMVAPVTDWIDHGKGSSNVAFVVIVSMVVVTGFADGLTAGSLIGTTGKLPGRYMQAVLAGNASAGVLVSVLRIVTKASLPQSPNGLRKSTQIYFLTSTFIELICIFCCNILHKLPIIRHHKKTHSNPKTTDTSKGPNLWQLSMKIRWLVISILAIYIVTLSIFPGYLSEDVKSRFFKDWYPILLITTFNVGDFVGKCLTGLYVPEKSKWAIGFCMARVLFYPLFVGCVYGPPWLRGEPPVVILTLMLGVSNGYLTSVLMILAPKVVPVEESEVVGIVMTLFLALGLVIGSALGWLWNI